MKDTQTQTYNINAVVASPVLDENGNNEPYFSWQPCECCNSSLGGERYDINYCIFDPSTHNHISEEIYEASVCVDCFVELCS